MSLDKTTQNLESENISPEVPQTPTTTISNETAKPDQADLNGAQIKQMGTTIKESNMPVKGGPSTGKTTGKSLGKRAEMHCNDANFTLHRLENKFNLVKTVEWDISAPIGTLLYKANVPNDILVTPAMKTPFDVTAFWRMSAVKFRVITKSSPHYGGSLVMGFFPSLVGNYELQGAKDMSRMIQMGAKIQHASDDQTIDFQIPFRHYLNFLEAPDDCLGQFGIYVLNPLRTGASNPNSIQVTIYVALENSEFKVPEFIPPTVYYSQKFSPIMSRAQSGTHLGKSTSASRYLQDQQFEYENEKLQGKVTYIEGPDKAANVNMNIASAPVTMLCAGKGYVSEPRVKQFQDHPVDIVQLRKRFRHTGLLLNSEGTPIFTVPGQTNIAIFLKGNDIITNQAGYMSKIFRLYRGSYIGKIIPYIIDGGSGQNVTFELFALNNLPSNVGNTVPGKEALGYYKGGSHYFSSQEPAEFMIPYMSPNFTAGYTGQGIDITDPMAEQQWYLVISVYNYSKSEVTISFDTYSALGDDFATGVFTGVPAEVFVKPGKNRMRTVVSMPQSGVLDMIDKAIETTLPILENIDELSNLLDAHPITFQRYPITSRKIGYTVATDNIQYLERLNVTNHNGLSLTDKEAFGMDKETDIYKLCREVKTLYRIIPWTTSMKQGELLQTFNIGPLPIPSDQTIPFGAVCPMDLFASEAVYWNGSIRFMIDVAASQQHKGQLTVTYHPNLSTPPAELNLATQQYFLTFDLSQGRATQYFDVPYLSKYSYRPVYNELDRIYGENNPFNGIICLWIQNPLRGSTTVSDQVDINIYRAAGPDFNLDVFSAFGNTIV